MGIHVQGTFQILSVMYGICRLSELFVINFTVKLAYDFLLNNDTVIISSADPKVSSAELMVLLICPSSVVRRRPSSVRQLLL